MYDEYDSDLVAQMRERYPNANDQTMQEILEFFSKMAEDILQTRSEQISFSYDEIYPEDLKPHPINITLYDGVISADDSLVNSILQRGLVEPLIINSKHEILSGNRRWLALLQINKEKKFPKIDAYTQLEEIFVRWKARCLIATFRDEKEERLAIIEYNKRSPKRASQLYNEIEILDSIYSAKYMHKKSSISLTHLTSSDAQTLKRIIKNSDMADYWDTSLEDAENVDAIRNRIKDEYEQTEKSNREAEGYIRTQIVEEINNDMVNINNIQKLIAIGRAAKEQVKHAKQLMKYLDCGKFTINGAYIIFWLFQQNSEIAKKLAFQVIEDIDTGKKKGVFTPTMAKKEYDILFPTAPKIPKRGIITDASGNRILRAEAKRMKKGV